MLYAIPQACRGRRYDFGTEVADEVDASADPEDVGIRRIPVEADFLMAYSVVPGIKIIKNSINKITHS